jgi:perosamine synthetase
MSDIQAALGLAQLERIDDLLAKRAAVAERYLRLLRSEDALLLPETPAHVKRSWFVFVIRTIGELAEQKRDALRAFLAETGIASQIYFPPIHEQPYFKELGYGPACDLPVTEAVSKTCLALPFFTKLSDAQAHLVVTSIREALNPVLSSIPQPEAAQALTLPTYSAGD